MTSIGAPGKILLLTATALASGWLLPGCKPGTADSPASAVPETVQAETPSRQPSPPPDEAAEPRNRMLAVLPLSYRSAGREQGRAFVNGLRDEWSRRLSDIEGIDVIARNSVLARRNDERSPAEIGRELGADWLLEGSVLLVGERIRVDLELIDAAAENMMWAEFWDRELTTQALWQIADAIQERVAASSGWPHDREAPPTESLEAYRLVVLSRESLLLDPARKASQAETFARRAIALDPDYAEARVALAAALLRGAVPADQDSAARKGAIAEVLDQALRLDPGNREAWALRAEFQSRSGDAGAAESWKRALESGPPTAALLSSQGSWLLEQARPAEALDRFDIALQKDPLSVETRLLRGAALERLGQLSAAREMYARTRELAPDSPVVDDRIARTWAAQGRLDRALDFTGRALALDDSDPGRVARMVLMNDSLEDQVAADQWSDWLDERLTRQPAAMAIQAHHQYLLGGFETAIQYANLALRLGLEPDGEAYAVFMRIKRDEALAEGAPEPGIVEFERRYPSLLSDRPKLNSDTLQLAVDLAALLQLAGRSGKARRLLEEIVAAYDHVMASVGAEGSWLQPARAEALALLGEDEAALAELRRIIDGGWRLYWRWETELNFNFRGLHNAPEFRDMVEELSTDMAAQRSGGVSPGGG